MAAVVAVAAVGAGQWCSGALGAAWAQQQRWQQPLDASVQISLVTGAAAATAAKRTSAGAAAACALQAGSSPAVVAYCLQQAVRLVLLISFHVCLCRLAWRC